MNTTVDNYLLNGCMRCEFGGTPECKVHRWTKELDLLREIVLECGLTEEVKWGVPCYTVQGKNVLMISALRGNCFISFFKGVLLADERAILEKAGEHTHMGRLIRFTATEEIRAIEADIKAYIYEAIEVEKAGLKVELPKNTEPIPAELEKELEDDPALKSAFTSLTPGQQRGYILYISAPKQSKTRVARIEKCVGKILNGEGLHDKYSYKRK